MRLIKENSALLVIDFQERLLPVMHDANQLVKNVITLIEGMQVHDVPVITTQQYTKGLGMTVEPIQSAIKDFDPIEKTAFSCFDVNQVVEFIKGQNIETIYICGIESHVCVLQTAVDLKDAGLNPVVVTDCISSRSMTNKEIALDRFRFENIMMTSYESVLFELTRGAKEPGFKEISRLVK